jgi:hypothetical protein
MICAQYLLASTYQAYWQASKLAQARADNNASYLNEIDESLKRAKQEGRIPPRAVARAEFCYRSLQGICYHYTIRRATLATAILQNCLNP